MKIYFAGAIRGGIENRIIYKEIITFLSNRGEVLTEHIGNDTISCKGETTKTDVNIYNRDLEWLKSADIMIAEVSTPSLGVGYELGIAEKLNIPVLCLYKKTADNNISAMIKGNIRFTCIEYTKVEDIQQHINDFLHNSCQHNN